MCQEGRCVAAEKAGEVGIDQVMKDDVNLLRRLDGIQNGMKHLGTM